MSLGSVPSVSHGSSILIIATVAAHLRSFHLPWARYLRERGFYVHGIARDISGCPACRSAFSQVSDIPFSRKLFSPRQVFGAGPGLRRLVSRVQPVVVHFHTPNAAFWGRLALRKEAAQSRCKVVYTAHGFHFHANGGAAANFLYGTAERLAARHTHALLTINSEDTDAAREFKLAPGGFHQQVPGAGIDLKRFDPGRFEPTQCHLALAASLRLPGDSRFVLMVAEFSRGKRHLDALAAFAEQNLPKTHLLFAGTGVEEENVIHHARRVNLGSRVHFLGHRQDIPKLLAGSSTVILPSEREGLPVSLLEAMAMEKPVVAADARGSRELVAPDCGWIHAVGDTRQLGSLIRSVLDNPAEARERARRGREKVRANYGWPAVRDKLMSVYQRLGVVFPKTDDPPRAPVSAPAELASVSA